nr:DnaJ domain [Mimivirus sp.]
MEAIIENARKEYISAKHKYIKLFMSQAIPKFINDTSDYVWDTEHDFYKYIKKPDDNISSCDSNTKKLYKKLILLAHPDKCDKNWSEEIFILINEAYVNNNYQKLQEIYQRIENNTIEELLSSNISSIDKMEHEINAWQSQPWYIWTSPDADANAKYILGQILITKTELQQRKQIKQTELENENNYLKNENNYLANLIDQLKSSQK